MKVEIPTSDADRLRLGRVGLVALGGFVLGMAWPRLAGVQLVPSPPAEEQAALAEPPAEASAAPASSAPPKTAVPPPAAKAAPAEVLTVNVGQATVTSCRVAGGGRRSECGTLALDSVMRAPLEALAACRAAGGARGTLSLGFDLDFEAGRIVELKSGKSTTLGNQTTTALLSCAKQHLEALSLEGIQHEHPRYTVYYSIDVTPNEGSAAPAAGGEGDSEIVAASGRATVSWGVALIRAEPKEGDVVARVLSGTRVVVTGRKGDWYRVKYDAKGSEGWVFRTAIGL